MIPAVALYRGSTLRLTLIREKTGDALHYSVLMLLPITEIAIDSCDRTVIDNLLVRCSLHFNHRNLQPADLEQVCHVVDRFSSIPSVVHPVWPNRGASCWNFTQTDNIFKVLCHFSESSTAATPYAGCQVTALWLNKCNDQLVQT